ncbi:MAG: hypothetical protein SFY69_09315 [Planctomycetota bacterium]|nr:hypothetical protein [Planctomycetota bacterium]
MAEQILKFIARFVRDDTGAPLSDPALRVRFLDRDLLRDDLLGESALSADGVAQVLCTSSAFRSGLTGEVAASLGEDKPDLYCEVREGDTPVFRTPVAWNTPVAEIDPVTKTASTTVDLGTFRFRRGEGFEGLGFGDSTTPLRPMV